MLLQSASVPIFYGIFSYFFFFFASGPRFSLIRVFSPSNSGFPAVFGL